MGTVPTPGADGSRSVPAISSADCCRLAGAVQQWCLWPQRQRWETPGHWHHQWCGMDVSSISYSRLLALRADHEFRRGRGRAWYLLLLSPGRPGSRLDLEIGLHIGDPQQLHRDSALPEWYKTALPQTQLFRRLIDRQNTKAVSFLNITHAPVKPWEGRGGLQFIQIFIYQLFIKSVLLKVTDNLVIVVECISHFCLSDLSFLWPGFYYLDKPFYFTEHQ